jgi:SHS2 domain-containing protein
MKIFDSKHRLIDHAADMGIVVYGTDLKNLFKGAAESMLKIMLSGVSARLANSRKLLVEGQDREDLMVRWLGEILSLMEIEREVVAAITINSISPRRLDARVETAPFDPDLQEILCEIKAVTYHQIEVVQKDDHWEARIIFDI